MTTPVRVLLLADTHLGIDQPARPRVTRRRRGDDFAVNYELALAPARRGEVDLVVHGGDLLYRSRVPARLVSEALAPLLRLADAGVDVVLVPGNHERSTIPYRLLASHPRLHVLDRPRTVELALRGQRVAVGGFPFEREARVRFAELVVASGLLQAAADVRLLCWHGAVEGACVGPSDFVFRDGADVVRGADVPAGIDAMLCGHIHRRQVLTRDLRGRPLAAPVLYPGSIERTSFAERHEPKGYLIVELAPGAAPSWTFHELPARPMHELELDPTGLAADELRARVRSQLDSLAPDAIVRVRLTGEPAPDAWVGLSAGALRALAPPSMNVSLALAREAATAAGRRTGPPR